MIIKQQIIQLKLDDIIKRLDYLNLFTLDLNNDDISEIKNFNDKGSDTENLENNITNLYLY